MKLVRYGAPGKEKPGVIAPDGTLRDLSALITDIGPEVLDPAALDRLTALDTGSLPAVKGCPRFGPVISNVGKFIGVGLNYADHAAESNQPIPTEPVIFMKATSCIGGPDDPVRIPRGSRKTDWEVELGVVIGKRTRYIETSDALSAVAGYTIVNDLSEREFQLERGGTWDKGKCCDTFGPIGPWLVTRDEIADPQDLGLWLDVNDTPRQRGHTSRMIFTVAEIISYLSHFMTLEPGDLITTGTPPGVGLGMKPNPVYLCPGDTIQLGISGLGTQRQEVVRWDGSRGDD